MASFKGYKRSIKLEFDYDEVKAGVPNVKQQMAVLNAEFKKSSAEAVASGKEIDKLGTRYDYLSNKIKIQEQEVEKYRDRLEKATNAKGNNTKAIQNNTASLEIAQAKLAQTKAELDKVTQEIEKQRTTLGKTSEEWGKLGDKSTELGESMTTKLTVPILAAAAASFKLGADMEDALGKTNAVFKQSAKEIETWAEGSFKNFGIAKGTALDMANSFGALASGMGLNITKTKEYSQSLTQLAVDMVAFHGGRLDVAETALNSIFTGETESLKKYGIVMTQANLQQFAYTQGIRKKVSEMTEAEKVQLRYNFVMDRSRNVVGHYQKEQDNATTQLLKFKEGLKTLGESFLEQVMPVFLPFINFLNTIIEKFSGLSDGTKKVIVVVGGLVAAVGPVLLLLGGLFKAISDISEGMKVAKKAVEGVSKVGSAISGLLTATGAWGFKEWAIAIGAVVALLTVLLLTIDALFNKGRGMEKLVGNIKNAFGDLGTSINNASGQGRNISSRYIDGSHKTGLDYVPYDGYIAELHRGERIVTAEENNGGSIGGDTFILKVKMDEVDEVQKLVRVFDNFRQAKRAGVVNG